MSLSCLMRLHDGNYEITLLSAQPQSIRPMTLISDEVPLITQLALPQIRIAQAAFVEIMELHQQRIYGMAMKLLKSHEQAEEIIQEVFARLWIKRDSLQHVQNLEAYLYAMSRNLITSQFKKQMQEVKACTEMAQETSDDPEEHMRMANYEHYLHQLIDQLPPQQRSVFRMAKLDGHSYAQIAQHLKISRFTVKNHMAVAWKTIRATLPGRLLEANK